MNKFIWNLLLHIVFFDLPDLSPQKVVITQLLISAAYVLSQHRVLTTVTSSEPDISKNKSH